MTSHDETPPAADRLLRLGLPVLVGTILRLWGIDRQILGGDELHAVRMALHRPASEMLFTWLQADYCIPLTVLIRLAIDAGFGVDELTFRGPSLSSGLLLLVVVPLALESRIGRRNAAILAWLLALSPGLVLYSRIARSYATVVLLGFLAVTAFERWNRTDSRRAAAAYVLLAPLAVYVHLGAGPFVLAPLPAALHPSLRGGRSLATQLKRLAPLGLGIALLLGSFMVPGREALAELARTKRQGGLPTLATLAHFAALEAGTRWRVPVLVFAGLAAAGAFGLGRRVPALGAYALSIVALHAAALLVLQPEGYQEPVVLHRYLLVTLPFVLTWVAVALGGVSSLAGERLGNAGVAGFLALLLVSGPLASRAYRTSSFAHHELVMAYHRPLGLEAVAISPFYARLAQMADGGGVLEVPFEPNWEYALGAFAAQALHGRELWVATHRDGLFVRPSRWMRFLPLERSALIGSPARWLVVHRDYFEESWSHIVAVDDPDWLAAPHRYLVRKYGDRARALAAELHAAWGPPVYADPRVEVWDLDAVRAGGRGPASRRDPVP